MGEKDAHQLNLSPKSALASVVGASSTATVADVLELSPHDFTEEVVEKIAIAALVPPDVEKNANAVIVVSNVDQVDVASVATAGYRVIGNSPTEDAVAVGLEMQQKKTQQKPFKGVASTGIELPSTTTEAAQKDRTGNRSITSDVRLNLLPNIPKDVYRFSPGEVSNAEKEWSATLVGALIGSSIPFNSMMDFMTNNWRIELPKLYIKGNDVMVLKFKSIEDRSWVLNRVPLIIDGNKPLILKEWSTGMKIDWSLFESVLVWVKILDIDPIFLSSSHMLDVIGNMIRKPISIDHITHDGKSSLMHVCLLR